MNFRPIKGVTFSFPFRRYYSSYKRNVLFTLIVPFHSLIITVSQESDHYLKLQAGGNTTPWLAIFPGTDQLFPWNSPYIYVHLSNRSSVCIS